MSRMASLHEEIKKGARELDSQQIIQSLQGQPTDAALQKRTTSKTYILRAFV